MRDLIFVSMENWDETWRRNQFICAELSRRHPEMKIIAVGLPRDFSHDLRRLRLRGLWESGAWVPKHLKNLLVIRPWKPLPDSLPGGRRLNQTLFRNHVRRMARWVRTKGPVLWLNPHWAVHMAGRMGERAVVYDITDDWISATQSERQRERVRREDMELCRRADAVIVCSRRLFEMKRPMVKNLHLIPNGVDTAHYEMDLSQSQIAKPVLGYTGTLHPDRVDVGLVEQVAGRMPEASVVLIGPNHLSPGDQARLRARGNVTLAGPVPYREIAEHMREFDVCITPHRVSEFTESLNPIKLWEYLALGKPIVSTDVAGFRDFPQLVRIARDAEHFVALVRQALQENGTLLEARRAEARRHSWKLRVDQIEAVLEQFGANHG